MKKVIIGLVLVVCSSMMATAQKGTTIEKDNFRFSGGFESGFAIGTTSNNWGFGMGISAQAEYFIMPDKLSITVLAGYNNYIGKSRDAISNYKSFNVVSLRAGARYYVVDGFNVGAQLGVGFIKTFTGQNTTAFAFSPQVGYTFKSNGKNAVDITLKYDGYSKSGTSSFVGIRVAYIF